MLLLYKLLDYSIKGIFWPYLVGFYAEIYLYLHKEGRSSNAIGSISEEYDGNPLHSAKGAISYAWNVWGISRNN